MLDSNIEKGIDINIYVLMNTLFFYDTIPLCEYKNLRELSFHNFLAK